MAAVRIARDPIASDSAADVPRQQWNTLMEERQRFCTQYLPKDCRNLLFFVEDGAANNWIGYRSAEAYIRGGLGLEPKMVHWAVAGLRFFTHTDRPIKFDVAAFVGELAEREIGIEGGKPGPGRGHKTGDNITRFTRGTSAAYLVARLKRDAPDLAAKVASGELSANAAAIEAGFRKPPSPLKALQTAWSRASEDDRAAFRAWVEEQ
jgi:hypothetical protein